MRVVSTTISIPYFYHWQLSSGVVSMNYYKNQSFSKRAYGFRRERGRTPHRSLERCRISGGHWYLCCTCLMWHTEYCRVPWTGATTTSDKFRIATGRHVFGTKEAHLTVVASQSSIAFTRNWLHVVSSVDRWTVICSRRNYGKVFVFSSFQRKWR